MYSINLFGITVRLNYRVPLYVLAHIIGNGFFVYFFITNRIFMTTDKLIVAVTCQVFYLVSMALGLYYIKIGNTINRAMAWFMLSGAWCLTFELSNLSITAIPIVISSVMSFMGVLTLIKVVNRLR